MEIIWHGQSCFTIKNNDITIVTDPYSGIGLKLPKLAADVITVSHQHQDHSFVEGVEGNPKVLDWAGEYEIKGVPFIAIDSFHYAKSEGPEAEKRGGNLIMVFEIDGVKMCHLGDLGHTLTNEMNEAIGDVDVLMVPVGGVYTIDHHKAHEVIEQIDPRLVIPMHYKVPGLTVELGEIEPFLKEIGQVNIEPINKLKLKKVDLPEDKTNFVVMTPITG
ncbi:MBL fold metallo-hydrolase [Candidatus Peregrinibacteria bacterium]|nr:MBL fold metallo-hydrolase [Candidatus Peregrinibacteria bacterium]